MVSELDIQFGGDARGPIYKLIKVRVSNVIDGVRGKRLSVGLATVDNVHNRSPR
jgi:hypothetical protein